MATGHVSRRLVVCDSIKQVFPCVRGNIIHDKVATSNVITGFAWRINMILKYHEHVQD